MNTEAIFDLEVLVTCTLSLSLTQGSLQYFAADERPMLHKVFKMRNPSLFIKKLCNQNKISSVT